MQSNHRKLLVFSYWHSSLRNCRDLLVGEAGEKTAATTANKQNNTTVWKTNTLKSVEMAQGHPANEESFLSTLLNLLRLERVGNIWIWLSSLIHEMETTFCSSQPKTQVSFWSQRVPLLENVGSLLCHLLAWLQLFLIEFTLGIFVSDEGSWLSWLTHRTEHWFYTCMPY